MVKLFTGKQVESSMQFIRYSIVFRVTALQLHVQEPTTCRPVIDFGNAMHSADDLWSMHKLDKPTDKQTVQINRAQCQQEFLSHFLAGILLDLYQYHLSRLLTVLYEDYQTN